MKSNKRLKGRAAICAAVAALTLTLGSSLTAFAVDAGSANTTYEGPYTLTSFTKDGATKATDYATPTAKDRCSLKYFGVDKYKKNADDVKIYAYHIIEGNYNKYGFLGWTETAGVTAAGVQLASFDKTENNVAQIVIEDNDPESPTYNKKKIVTSKNVTDLASAIVSNKDVASAFEKVELTWNENLNCYATDNAEAGSYLVLVEKEDRGVIYNPVIISNDYADANIALSLSNVTATAKDGEKGSLHDDSHFNASKYPYKSGVNKNNTAFVTYGSYKPSDIYGLATNDNKDKAPQDQTKYIESHETIVYYKDTQLNGNVYAQYQPGADETDKTVDDTKIETLAFKGKAYAKKSTILLEKNIVNTSVPKSYGKASQEYSKYEDVAEGDTITYDILTEIPNYAEGYFKDEQKFLFKVTDTQHEGLAAVNKDNIKVHADYAEGAENNGKSDSVDAQAIATDIGDDKFTVDPKNYTITINDDNSFSVEFTKDYCLANQGRKIVIRYTTTVTADAAKGLNGNPNEVYLEYTTLPTPPTPDSQPSRGYKFDFAVAYTFSPTAFKLAEDGTVTPVDGTNEVTTEDQADIAKGETVVKPLPGAKFKLQRVGTNYSTENGVVVAKEADIAPDTTKYNANPDTKYAENGYRTWFLTSDENGMIKFDSEFDGIDEGIYTLQEIEAPKDYTINEKIYVINVNPKFDEAVQRFIGTDVKMKEAGKLTYDGMTFVDGTNYEYDKYGQLLREYTYSEWASGQTDNYDGSIANLTTDNPPLLTTVKYDTVGEGEAAKEVKVAETDLVGIIDTKLTRLPSTGGIGTIVFTVSGFALLGASAFLISKKKDNENEQ